MGKGCLNINIEEEVCLLKPGEESFSWKAIPIEFLIDSSVSLKKGKNLLHTT